ncbi:hypothetical protein BDV96DRAFT_594046 [Lophiotrema nucula]|uniref:BTB domain-containing protein n=1 Tax=Lophiotrema nucula TaxID=690887 RepID=A0A6A5ZR21_9PLEO|nr:hypothetical protein BDV96DRAFT_594046 [Lophiotrema nucula]
MAKFRDARVEADSELNVDLSGHIVKLVVGGGDNQKRFSAHSSVLVARSDFFKKCLSGPWKEATDQVVTLPDDHPEVLYLYLQLLYSNCLPIKNPDEDADGKTGFEFITLSKLYVLAEKLQDRKTKNIMIETMISKARGLKRFPGLEAIRIIYNGTAGPCPGRQLMVDMYTEKGSGGWVTKGMDNDRHPDFLLDLAVSLLDKRAKPTTSTVYECDASKYHEREV